MASPYAPVGLGPHDQTPTHSTFNLNSSNQSYISEYRDEPDAPFAMRDRNNPYAEEDQYEYPPVKQPSKKKGTLIIIVTVIILIIVLAVALPVYFVVIKPRNGSSSNSNGGGGGKTSTTSGAPRPSSSSTVLAVTGADGSRIKMEDGTEFTYRNALGGHWYFDPADPLNLGAKAQSYTPALNETWRYGVDKIRGVNLGGWLNLEPFISPAPFEKYSTATPRVVDEYTLSLAMAADTAGGGLEAQLEEHYKTFITEKDFADIAGAGLNWLRIPIGYWAIETWPGEPFLPRVSWNYFLKAVEWARKYGLRIQLDLHALPGSQNAWNHSGRLTYASFLNGTMGVANAQRSLTYIRILAQFISQPEYRDVIPMFGIINEPRIDILGRDALENFYYQAYQLIREIGGTGEGNGPVISIHEGMQGVTNFANFLPGADRLALDTHTYFAFDGASDRPLAEYIPLACSRWGPMMTTSNEQFGLTTAGEWSLAINDCGLFVTGVGDGTRYEGDWIGGAGPRIGSCDEWRNWDTWDQTRKDQFKELFLTSMESLQDYFFWTWNIGNSSATGKVESPFWSYKLAVEQGWAPADPREAEGACARHGSPFQTFTGPLQPWQTGGPGGGISAADTARYGTFPPAAVGANDLAADNLPIYTPTGTVITMPVATYTKPGTSETINVGSGWFSNQDTSGAYVPIEGCDYPDTWISQPGVRCTGPGAKLKRAPRPQPTPPPS